LVGYDIWFRFFKCFTPSINPKTLLLFSDAISATTYSIAISLKLLKKHETAVCLLWQYICHCEERLTNYMNEGAGEKNSLEIWLKTNNVGKSK
jgi:hypothetical protein